VVQKFLDQVETGEREKRERVNDREREGKIEWVKERERRTDRASERARERER